MNTVPRPQEGARAAADAADTAVEDVAEHPVFEAVARGGFVMSGLVHVLIGAIALRIATGGSSQEADQSGALRAVAAAPGGEVLLWIGGIAMVALTLWHLAEAWIGARWKEQGRDRLKHVARTLGKAVVYGALAGTVLRFAAGGGSDSGEQTSQLTAGLMGNAAGRAAIIALGLVVISIGLFHVYRGASRGFEDQLRVPPGRTVARTVVVTGVAGYIAKGIALLGVGMMFGWAALGADPEKATGLDGALKTMAELPAGGIVLAVVAAGLILFGIYSVLRARYAPM
ncbi:DUF1206 domain-containing protein [Brachybacterium saurashtrense]|uniref:DUF1206 domain-containing protein n=1 Tax=Brachybacterium saurashtrense TaxID=556288 RepID=A0A345YTM4_9MICO|nr:DUF1206 domain-containing protein [Brachybacterium saurashtrense]AXK47276.1 DUF1206 domain-containing protein [Brachybacterium saurashtrense]RRR24397.1 DUF1206 domain-containing protein [Brachybacterium saurashtrense]